MPTKQGGSFRRQNGKLEQISKPAQSQRYGAHKEHPSTADAKKSPAAAPAVAPAAAPSSAKTSAPVKGDSDANATT